MAVDLGNGTWGAGAESLHWILYDRVRLLVATLTHRLFNLSPGDVRAGAALTIADTNNWGPQIPSGHKYTAHEMILRYTASEVRTEAELVLVLNALNSAQYRSKIDGKDTMQELPLWHFTGGLNAIGAAAAVGANPLNATIFEAKLDLKIPLILQELTRFSAEIEFTAATDVLLNGDFIEVEYIGRLDRRN